MAITVAISRAPLPCRARASHTGQETTPAIAEKLRYRRNCAVYEYSSTRRPDTGDRPDVESRVARSPGDGSRQSRRMTISETSRLVSSLVRSLTFTVSSVCARSVSYIANRLPTVCMYRTVQICPHQKPAGGRRRHTQAQVGFPIDMSLRYESRE